MEHLVKRFEVSYPNDPDMEELVLRHISCLNTSRISTKILPPETHAGDKDSIEKRVEVLENLHEDAMDWLHTSKPHENKVELPTCGTCGGKQVYIRGIFPHAPERLTCPTCCQEKIDHVREFMSNDWGKVSQDLSQKEDSHE